MFGLLVCFELGCSSRIDSLDSTGQASWRWSADVPESVASYPIGYAISHARNNEDLKLRPGFAGQTHRERLRNYIEWLAQNYDARRPSGPNERIRFEVYQFAQDVSCRAIDEHAASDAFIPDKRVIVHVLDGQHRVLALMRQRDGLLPLTIRDVPVQQSEIEYFVGSPGAMLPTYIQSDYKTMQWLYNDLFHRP